MYVATRMKCTLCNTFFNPNSFFINDINDMRKRNKLLKCKTCKNYNSYKPTTINYIIQIPIYFVQQYRKTSII